MFFDNSNIAVKKLTILYILKQFDMPLTKNQINNIVLENNLIDYFTLQECLTELEKNELISQTENNQKLCYMLSKNGIQTIEVLQERISQTVKELIDNYIIQNKDLIKQETEIQSDFYKKSDNEYIVNLKVIEDQITIIDLKLSVVSAKQAKLICEKWKLMSQKIYGDIISALIN